MLIPKADLGDRDQTLAIIMHPLYIILSYRYTIIVG